MTVKRPSPRRRHAMIVAAVATAAVALSGSPAWADPIEDIEAEIEDEAFDLGGVVEEYNAISEDLDDLEEDIAALEEELEPYETELEALYDDTEALTVSAYQQGDMNGAAALLNAGSPDTFTAQMTALDGIAAADAAVIGEVNEVKSEFDEDLAVLEEMREDAAELAEELEETQETIEAAIERLQDDRRDAYREERGDSEAYIPDYVPGDRGVVVNHAMAQVGKPYSWATAGPDAYDCSGLMLDAYSQLGISLAHNAARQYNNSTRISRDQLEPGDLVFYNNLQHVAMYLGDDYVVHAPTFGQNVKVEKLDAAATPYYGAGRVL